MNKNYYNYYEDDDDDYYEDNDDYDDDNVFDISDREERQVERGERWWTKEPPATKIPGAEFDWKYFFFVEINLKYWIEAIWDPSEKKQKISFPGFLVTGELDCKYPHKDSDFSTWVSGKAGPILLEILLVKLLEYACPTAPAAAPVSPKSPHLTQTHNLW